MQSKISSRRTWLIIFLAGLALLLAFFLYYSIKKNAVLGNPTALVKDAVVLPKQEQPNFELPVRLKIPKINVDAVVEYVGATPEGALGVPKGPANAGWFNLGPRPGDIGSAIITGHYGTWKNGQGSVFDDLHKLRKGDTLSVEDEKGVNITFVVREFGIYGPAAIVPSVFFLNDGASHLNLITCDGDWDDVKKTYSNRLVIFTDKENQ